jgi:hypothetical protein
MSDLSAEPTFDRLIDWLDDRLPADQAARLSERAAAGGPELERTVAWLRAYLAAAGRIHFRTSPALQTRLAALFTDRERGRPLSVMIRRYVAELVSDSGVRANQAGLRGASDAPRQLLFSSDVADIVLSMSATNGATLLHGQIFPNTEEPADRLLIQLFQDSIEVRMTVTDGTGHFEFANLPPGAYALVAVGNALEVQTAAITISA